MRGPTRMLRSPPSPRASGWGMLAPKPSVVGLIFQGKSRPTSEIVAHPGTDHLPRRDRDRGLLRLGSRFWTSKSSPTLPPSRRARARAREAAGNQRPWPADKVERWGIDRLIPYA